MPTPNFIQVDDRGVIMINESRKSNPDEFALLPVTNSCICDYAKFITEMINDFIDTEDLYANTTVFNVDNSDKLALIQMSFSSIPQALKHSEEDAQTQINRLNKIAISKGNIDFYARQVVNYMDDRDIFIIRPNQNRFWSEYMAEKDKHRLIGEIVLGTELPIFC